MTGVTTGQTSLATATDSDDTEAFLTGPLTTDLQSVANLFESATGHDHTGAGKGKPIGSAGIASGITLTSPVVSGPLTLTDAASRIVPGATSLSLRNTANSADNLLVSDAGGVTVRNGLTLTAGSIVVPQPGSSATFGLDASTGGSVAVLNAAAYAVFGASNNFGGLLLVHDVSNGEAALVMVASNNTFLVFQSGATFSVTPGAAAKTSVYLSTGSVTIQNQIGATHNYQFLSLRSRGLA